MIKNDRYKTTPVGQERLRLTSAFHAGFSCGVC